VHQSVVVMPHWIVTPDADGVWKTTLRLSIGNLKAGQPASPHVGQDRTAFAAR
jgi:hypothetical protein